MVIRTRLRLHPPNAAHDGRSMNPTSEQPFHLSHIVQVSCLQTIIRPWQSHSYRERSTGCDVRSFKPGWKVSVEGCRGTGGDTDESRYSPHPLARKVTATCCLSANMQSQILVSESTHAKRSDTPGDGSILRHKKGVVGGSEGVERAARAPSSDVLLRHCDNVLASLVLMGFDGRGRRKLKLAGAEILGTDAVASLARATLSCRGHRIVGR